MKVFKFGGASINSIERIQNVANIIQSYENEPLLIVVSAMGKTTNALEKVAEAFFEGNKKAALDLFEQIKISHLNLLKYLTVTHWEEAENQLKEFITEIEWLLHDKPVRKFDYYYDQIVCCGELMSTSILYYYLKEQKASIAWVDARDIIRTDNNFRDASVDWRFTQDKITQTIQPLFSINNIVLTQGFIGATDENESVTLGREGSDYSAALFANMLQSDSVTIWKDVDAVMSGDPKKYNDATNIHALSYTDVIEMAYYGAQVIHPKTIKPLQNKNIPLLVKSFLNPSLPGTRISNDIAKGLPPIVVLKEKQVLIQFKSKDFSFIGEKPIQDLQEIFNEVKIKPNVTQNTAISLLSCFDDKAEKIDELASKASMLFDVSVERNLSLITVRHYHEDVIEKLTSGKTILLEQKTLETAQMIIR